MLAVCNRCHNLFRTTMEDAYTPGVICAPCANHAECMRLALLHVEAGGRENSPTYSALLGQVRLLLRSEGIDADPAAARAEAEQFISAMQAAQGDRYVSLH